MNVPNHQQENKVSPGGSLESQTPEKKTDHDRIEELEDKVVSLDRIVTSLKGQVKFLTDILRKEAT